MAPAAFLFGKLPAHGDFVARGLSDAGRAAWDDRGAALLSALRARTGERFEAAHVQAPPWRFLSRVDTDWTAGAVAPSVDGVGRRFLLALGAAGLAPALAGGAGLAFAEAAEGLIYDAFADGLGADALLARAADRFADLHAACGVACTTLGALPAGDGLWWTLGSETFAPAAASGGAPPHDLFARTVALEHA